MPQNKREAMGNEHSRFRLSSVVTHVLVFLASTALAIFIMWMLEHLIGERFAVAVEEVQKQTWAALAAFQPWRLAMRYWDVLQSMILRGSDFWGFIEQHGWAHLLGAAFAGTVMSPLYFVAALTQEPAAQVVVNSVQLIAGGLLAWAVVDDLDELSSYLLWIVLTLVFTTVLSIPVLLVMYLAAVVLGGIIGPQEASRAAAGGSIAAVVSIFSARSFEAGVHQGIHHWIEGLVRRTAGGKH
jgi:hypothetical protein